MADVTTGPGERQGRGHRCVPGRLAVWAVYVGMALSAVACESRTSASNRSADATTFPVPRQIVVSTAPYASVEAALEDQDNVDWVADEMRARAVTLSYAAKELRDHLAAIGIDVSIASSASSEPSIVLTVQEGIESWGNVTGPVGGYKSFGNQGYAITPANDSLYITANDRIGVLYAVYRLLDYLGFAWYDPDETHVPTNLTAATRIVWPSFQEAPRVQLRGFWIYGIESISDEFAVWLARNRFNLGGRTRESLQRKLGLVGWGGEHDLLQQEFSRPGLFEQHPEWYAFVNGARQPVVESGIYYFGPAFVNPEAAVYFADRLIQRLETGDLRGFDVINIWPADSRFNLFDQSPEAVALGNETDNLLQFYSNVRARFSEARADGRLSRDVVVAGISYFLTMTPPTNPEVVARLENTDYLHIFYLYERDWSDYIDAGLESRDASRKIRDDLTAWEAIANFNYGVVEYHNSSVYAAVGLSDFQYLPRNFEILIEGRDGLFAYLHPLASNPGPRRITNALLARLAWQDLRSVGQSSVLDGHAEQIVREFFERRYGRYAEEWREIHEMMAQSVDNAKEMFGVNSLYWVLFQELIWVPPPYTSAEATEFIPRYRAGDIQDLPAAFSGVSAVRERFRGLDDSIRLQEQAQKRWESVLSASPAHDLRQRMDADVAWFAATASRYRLMAATCDYMVAREHQLDLAEPRARMAREIAFLAASQVTDDTISPVDQRGFLNMHKTLADIP